MVLIFWVHLIFYGNTYIQAFFLMDDRWMGKVKFIIVIFQIKCLLDVKYNLWYLIQIIKIASSFSLNRSKEICELNRYLSRSDRGPKCSFIKPLSKSSQRNSFNYNIRKELCNTFIVLIVLPQNSTIPQDEAHLSTFYLVICPIHYRNEPLRGLRTIHIRLSLLWASFL